MTTREGPGSATRKPRVFTPIFAYIETGFARRCLPVIERAMRERCAVIAVSLPREGKSETLREFLRRHPVVVVAGRKHTDVLATRTPHAGSDKNALMYQLGSRLTPILRMSPSAYLTSLIGATLLGGVTLVVIDDAHELTKAQRNWLREFVDLLLDPSDPKLTGVHVGVVYLAAGLPQGKQNTALFAHGPTHGPTIDLDWLQFEGRLDGREPVAWLPGLDLADTAEALAGLEDLYRPAFPDLELVPYSEDLFAALLDDRIDYAATGRVRMDSVVKCVLAALSEDARTGGWGGDLGGPLARYAGVLAARPHDLDEFSFDRRGIED